MSRSGRPPSQPARRELPGVGLLGLARPEDTDQPPSAGQRRSVGLLVMITAHALTKRYGTTTAVDNLTFEVSPGVVTVFLGPNGSGKFTTMRMIMGLDVPDSGSALIDGKPFRDLSWPLREVGGRSES